MIRLRLAKENVLPAQWVETGEIPVGDLTRFPGNARRGNVAKIRESIKANGQYRSLVVRQCDDGLIILAGNHTYDALCAEGHPTARCEVITCTDREARKINIADNRLSDLALDDNDALVELLSYLDEDYEGTGYTQENIDFLLGHKDDGDEGSSGSTGGTGPGGDGGGGAEDPVEPGWLLIRIQVPRELHDRWTALFDAAGEDIEDYERAGAIITLAEQAKASSLLVTGE
jgi:hypothetical protein